MKQSSSNDFFRAVIATVITGIVIVGVLHVTRLDKNPAFSGIGRIEAPTMEAGVDIDMAVVALTTTEHGPSAGYSLRWAGPTVTYSLTPGTDWSESFLVTVNDAIAWAEANTGLDFVEVPDGSSEQISISGRAEIGGYTTLYDNGDGTLRSAYVEFGCCSTHSATEELAQMLGPIADSADARSIFSLERTQLTPSAWDAWLVRGLYRVHPGATPAELAVALNAEPAPEATLDPRMATSD
jgi:hypothetical protein